MSSKIAVAIAHGICVGNGFDEEESSKYAGGMAQALKLKLADLIHHQVFYEVELFTNKKRSHYT